MVSDGNELTEAPAGVTTPRREAGEAHRFGNIYLFIFLFFIYFIYLFSKSSVFIFIFYFLPGPPGAGPRARGGLSDGKGG